MSGGAETDVFRGRDVAPVLVVVVLVDVGDTNAGWIAAVAILVIPFFLTPDHHCSFFACAQNSEWNEGLFGCV